MPSQPECNEVLGELIQGLSHQAIGRMLAAGLPGLTAAEGMKALRILTCGAQDEEELRLGTAAAESMGTTVGQPVHVFLQDLGLTGEQVLDMPVSELRQLLVNDWAGELERTGTPY